MKVLVPYRSGLMIAPWLAQAALYGAAEYLDDGVEEEEEDTDG